MAPEQAEGGVPSPASDVWGLGVTLFELVTGRRPFPQGTKARPFPQLEAPPTPLRALRPRAPQALEALLRACLAPVPQDRPPLPALLPALNRLIPKGPTMWPHLLNQKVDDPTSANLA